MSLLAAYAVPHPPLIVPAVGRGEEREIADTIESFHEVARRTAAHKPDTIVVVSPHAPLYRDGFFVGDAAHLMGSMAAFRAPSERLAVSGDPEFARALMDQMSRHGVQTAGSQSNPDELDHATFVPLYFLAEQLDLSQVKVVRVGLSGLSDAAHRFMGHAIAQVADVLDRRCVLIASGDWSHKLKPEGPYGFVEAGPRFDAAIADIFERGALSELFKLDHRMCQEAAECGLRSFKIMAAALEGQAFENDLLSYEGPFGVGYGVAAFEVVGADDLAQEEAAEADPHEVDPLVALARQTVETYVRSGSELTPSQTDLPLADLEHLMNRRAGVFVSLHERGDLRGCIGTIVPTCPSLAQEIIQNGISACSRDPRFAPVRVDELDYLSYSVDVLGEPEPIFSLEQLDPKVYGVIVSRGLRRGLLLPDLEGVDTVYDQLAIAKQKAGIRPDEEVKLERFQVVRHSAGGQARCYD